MRNPAPLLLALLALAGSCEQRPDGPDDTDTDDGSDTDTDEPCSDVEICDGIDSDCDGVLGPAEVDSDGDGVLDCQPCEDAGLYGATAHVTGAELVEALRDLTAAQTCSDYLAARELMFGSLDNVDGTVRCVYTGRDRHGVTGVPDPSEFNAEHTWPRSQGADRSPAECDLHHLFPTEALANNYRADNPFGHVVSDVSTGSYDLGASRLGTDASGELVFEPADWHKGNVARAVLYFAMRYPSADASTQLPPSRRAQFADWHRLDPVDGPELERSLRIGDRQGAPNPLVVCPHLVDAL